MRACATTGRGSSRRSTPTWSLGASRRTPVDAWWSTSTTSCTTPPARYSPTRWCSTSTRSATGWSRAWRSGTDGGRVALLVLLPAAHVVRCPGGPVHRVAGKRRLQVVDVDVPVGQHLGLEVL